MASTIPLRLIIIRYCKLGTLQIRNGNVNKWRRPLIKLAYLALFDQQYNDKRKLWLLLTWSKVALSKYVLKMWQNMKSLQPKYQISTYLSRLNINFHGEHQISDSRCCWRLQDQMTLLTFRTHSLQTAEAKSAILKLRTNKGKSTTSVKRQFTYINIYFNRVRIKDQDKRRVHSARTYNFIAYLQKFKNKIYPVVCYGYQGDCKE